MASQENYDFGSQELNTQDLHELENVSRLLHAQAQSAEADALEDDLTEYDGENDEDEQDALFGLTGVLEDLPGDAQHDTTVDPFTAAQLEERALQRQQSALSQGYRDRSTTADAEGDEVADDVDDADDLAADLDGSFAFTQKLLTNAKTLRELQSSGAPALEIAYEAPVPVRIPTVTSTAAALPRASQRLPTSQRQPSQTPRPTQEAYEPLTFQRFSSFRTLAEDALCQGRFEQIPVRTLQDLSFEQAKQCLHATRVYRFDDQPPSFSACLQNLFDAKAVNASPVFRIAHQHGTSLLLQDAHPEPCTVLAHALYTGLEEDAETDALQLTHFFFDHAVTFGSNRRSYATTVEDAAEPLPGQGTAPYASQSSGGDALPPPFPPSPDASLSNESSPPSAVLMIVAANRVHLGTLQESVQALATQRQQQASLFELGRQLSEAESVQEEQVMPAEEAIPDLDVDDFPVEYIDE